MLDREYSKAELEAAIHDGQFVLHYQPIVNCRDIDNVQPIGLEALVRWQRGDELLSPGHFMPFIASTGLGVKFGEYVMRTAFVQMRQWQIDGLVGAQYISVNVSDEQFMDSALPLIVRRTLRATRLHHSMVHLEISETSTLNDGAAVEQARALRRESVTVVLDDIGTEQTHMIVLARMRRAGVSGVKIDRSYVALADDRDMREALIGIIAVARKLGMSIVAEGVETTTERDFLRMHDCNRQQGFLFCKPMPADDVTKYLAAREAEAVS